MNKKNLPFDAAKTHTFDEGKNRLFGELLMFAVLMLAAYNFVDSMVAADTHLRDHHRHLLAGGFLVYVRQSDDSQVPVELSADDTVGDVIKELEAQRVWQQGMALCFANETLKPNETLADLGIGAEATLHVTVLYRPFLDFAVEDYAVDTCWNFKAVEQNNTFFGDYGSIYSVSANHNGIVLFTNTAHECLMRLFYNTVTGSIHSYLFLCRGENGLYADKLMPMLEEIEIQHQLN